MTQSYRIDEINRFTNAEFVDFFKEVVECSAWVAKKAVLSRPFADLPALQAIFGRLIQGQDSQSGSQTLKLHPELSGREARSGELTQFSSQEQKRLGLDRLSPENYQYIKGLNAEYKKKFGFPFVICVKQIADLDQLFKEFGARLKRDREEELKTGLEQVSLIARFRLAELVKPG